MNKTKAKSLEISLWQSLPTLELLRLANEAREAQLGSKFELCSITNAKSGLCPEDCKFCAQSSRHSTQIPIYPLKSMAEILKEAQRAREIGAERFGIVTSGRALAPGEVKLVAQTIREIKKQTNLKLCASLGSLPKSSLVILKESGLERYHHNIETSPEFFPHVVSTHSFDEKIKTIKAAKELGFEVCSGGIIGMGEDEDDRISMALVLKELQVDSVPINILVPIAGTPLEKKPPISILDILRAIALFRLILPDKSIKIAAGRESILKDFQGQVFLAGANGMLIGGYLTLKGREIEEDHRLVKEIAGLWSG